MDKLTATKIIRDTFEQPFNKAQYTYFVKELLNLKANDDNSFSYYGAYIPDSFKPYIKKYDRIDKYLDIAGNRIDILAVHLERESSLERARTMQRNFIAGYLAGKYGSDSEKNAALVAFISPDSDDWRFSLVKMEYRLTPTEKGIKAEEELTPARRYSFLVGKNEPNHTAQQQLVPLLIEDTKNPTLADFESAFNIEKVTKEFFIEYRGLFIKLKESLDEICIHDKVLCAEFLSKSVDTVNLAKKLLGQITFLYFLQKKGWFGVGRDDDWGTGSKQFLRELFDKKHGNYNNFFNDILEPLFYDALRLDRSHDDHYYSRFNCKIPFLNGGLFDPIGNYDWVHTDINLPDNLFSNKNENKITKDIGDGILDVFDRYNFTVKEDEPFEKEVAIDPELLGKTYEKFNAIRPDNFEEYKKVLKSGIKGDESKFNKQYGVYYTPREIVHYMCQESLINYLYTELNQTPVAYEKLGNHQLDMLGNKAKSGQLDITVEHQSEESVPKEDIEILIHYGEIIKENEEQVNKIGKETATYSHKLPESIRKYAKEIDKSLQEIMVCDPAIGSGAFPVGMMTEIVKVRDLLSIFIQKGNRSHYDFKRHCIEKSLYGVDIDPGAVEIAKLRLWLSLVVDEYDIKKIKPLPNLDYKIVCGNSLLGVEKDLFNEKLFSEL